MNPFFFLNKQGALRRKPFLGLVGGLALALGALAIGLSHLWPDLWWLFAILEAAALAALVYAVTARIVRAKPMPAADPGGPIPSSVKFIPRL